MTEYAPRSSQDYNTFPYDQHLAMSHYSNGNGLSYLYGNGQIQYQTVSTPCSTYSPTYPSSQGTSSNGLYMPTSSGQAFQYFPPNARVPPTLPSQSRAYPMGSNYVTSSAHRSLPQHHQRLASPREYTPMDCTECQDSPNQDTMLSEPVVPPLDGYPDVHEFDELMKRCDIRVLSGIQLIWHSSYVQDLSPKKQDKALIQARRAANIKHVLIDKKTTSIESAQFRSVLQLSGWFILLTFPQILGQEDVYVGTERWQISGRELLAPEIPNQANLSQQAKKICHEGKPVAVREKLFKILTKAHKQCQHGGRDKTSAQVRKVYSWSDSIPATLLP